MTTARGLARAAGLAMATGSLAAAGSLLAAPPVAAAPASSIQSGWWNTATTGAIPAPTTTSQGLQVSNGPSGPVSFSAIRFTLPSGTDTSGTVNLTLDVQPNSSVGSVAVSACPTTSAWNPGPNQPNATAPKYDCDQARADGGISPSGAQMNWRIPVSWANGASTISFALVPTPGSQVPFSISYDTPTASSVDVPENPPPPAPAPASSPAPSSASSPAYTAPSGSLTGSSSPTATPAGPSSGSSAPALTPGAFTTPPAVAGSALAPGFAPSVGSVSPAPSIAGGSASTNQSAASPAALGAPNRSSAAKPASGGPRRGPRIMAVVLLMLVGAALFVLAGRPERLPRLLGPFGARLASRGLVPATGPEAAAARMGGIGRFARPRIGPPKRL